MRKTKLAAPYDAKGKTTFRTRGVAGVYLIFKDSKLRYVGHSKVDVYKTMYRHFQEWNDNTQSRVTYKHLKDIKCRVIYCTPTQAANLERALILKYRPPDNIQKLELFELSKQDEKLIEQANNSADAPF